MALAPKTLTEHAPSITLFRGFLDPGKHVWSPFVNKLETRLRFAGVKYKTDAGSPLKSPKGKIPYVEYRGRLSAGAVDPSSIREDGISDPVLTISDSSLIARVFVESGILPDLNENLSPEEKALDLGVRTMLEDKLYFYQTKERWIDNYYTMRDKALWAVPYPVRVIVGLLAYRKQLSTLYGQGTTRFTNAELTEFKREIWGTVAGLLQASKGKALAREQKAEAPYWALGGEKPTEADTTLFGFIVSVLITTAGPDSQKVVREFPILLEYAERIHDRYFPDYKKGGLFALE